MKRRLNSAFFPALILISVWMLSLSSCGNPLPQEAQAKEQDEQLSEADTKKENGKAPGNETAGDSSETVIAERIVVPCSLQGEEAAWFGTGNEVESALAARFTSTEEIEAFFREKYQHMEPGDNEDLKKYWEYCIQPEIDAARAAYGESFFEDRELLLFCVKTGTSTYKPVEYALVRSGCRLTLLYSVEGPDAGPDGTVRVNSDLGLFPVLVAVYKSDLDGVEKYAVSPRTGE